MPRQIGPVKARQLGPPYNGCYIFEKQPVVLDHLATDDGTLHVTRYGICIKRS